MLPPEKPAAKKPGQGTPSPLPSFMPFIAMAVLLIVLYGGFLLFPTIKRVMNQQDCIASGRTDCIARPPAPG